MSWAPGHPTRTRYGRGHGITPASFRHSDRFHHKYSWPQRASYHHRSLGWLTCGPVPPTGSKSLHGSYISVSSSVPLSDVVFQMSPLSVAELLATQRWRTVISQETNLLRLNYASTSFITYPFPLIYWTCRSWQLGVGYTVPSTPFGLRYVQVVLSMSALLTTCHYAGGWITPLLLPCLHSPTLGLICHVYLWVALRQCRRFLFQCTDWSSVLKGLSTPRSE